MAAKAILSAKPNSFPFEDRVIVLEVPAKIGRSHKDDQVRSVITSFLHSLSLSLNTFSNILSLPYSHTHAHTHTNSLTFARIHIHSVSYSPPLTLTVILFHLLSLATSLSHTHTNHLSLPLFSLSISQYSFTLSFLCVTHFPPKIITLTFKITTSH